MSEKTYFWTCTAIVATIALVLITWNPHVDTGKIHDTQKEIAMKQLHMFEEKK